MYKIMLLATAGLLACTDKGDDTGGGSGAAMPTCDDAFTACGGDPTGSWIMEEVCVEYTYTDESCPAATWEFDIDITGGLQVEGDGTYALDSEITSTWNIEIPKDCLGGASCEALNSEDGLTCTDEGASCLCAQVETNSELENGVWEASGSQFTMTPEGEEPTVASYCVASGSLELEVVAETPDDPQVRLILSR